MTWGDPKHGAEGKRPDSTATSVTPFIGHSRKGHAVESGNPWAIAWGREGEQVWMTLKELEGIFRSDRNRMMILVVVVKTVGLSKITEPYPSKGCISLYVNKLQ